MKIEFLKAYQLGVFKFNVGDQLKIENDMMFEIMNNEYYLLIFKGLRYDLKKEDIKIIQD